MPRRGIHGFRYVTATQQEIEEFRSRTGRNPSVRRARCVSCGQRVWASGLGVGSHRRACRGGGS